MGKHAKEYEQNHLANIGIITTDETQTYKEAAQVVKDVQIIDDSIKRHPFPPDTK